MRRATDWPPVRDIIQWISIHALLAESDQRIAKPFREQFKFLSTLSLRRATGLYLATEKDIPISIHALLAESDLRVLDGSKSSIISIHALLAESDRYSLRRSASNRHFYPRSPCGERPNTSPGAKSNTPISIHALLAESDLMTCKCRPAYQKFLSTLSLRRATSPAAGKRAGCYHFYPRSPCGERPFSRCGRMTRRYFYPRSPCGERPGAKIHDPGKILFLSTLSLRRATG